MEDTFNSLHLILRILTLNDDDNDKFNEIKLSVINAFTGLDDTQTSTNNDDGSDMITEIKNLFSKEDVSITEVKTYFEAFINQEISENYTIRDCFDWKCNLLEFIKNDDNIKDNEDMKKLTELVTSTEYTDTDVKISTTSVGDSYITINQCEDILELLLTSDVFNGLEYQDIKNMYSSLLGINSDEHCIFLLNKLRENIKSNSNLESTDLEDTDNCINSCIHLLGHKSEEKITDLYFTKIGIIIVNMNNNNEYWIKRAKDIRDYILDQIEVS